MTCRILPVMLFAACAAAAEVSWRQSDFDIAATGWSTWAARAEIAPRTYVERGTLAVSGASNAAAYGGWRKRIDNVTPGEWYRLVAHYRAEAVPNEQLQVLARLDWQRADGKRAGQPDYAYRVEPSSTMPGWKRLTLEAPAPERATALHIELFLQNAPLGTVWWDDLSFASMAAPGPRKVTVAAVNLRPRNTASAAESVNKFVETVQAKVASGTDVILLPEGITIVGTGKKYLEVAEPIPGPTTQRLGELAKAKNAYVVAGIVERDGVAAYNTAVLIDRQGQVAGKYRKVYLPREEIEGGLTPGVDYPTFATDFGRVGVMICWDLQYADPARALARRGAELILVPIWGGNETLGKARAIENRVFIAASGYDYPTYVMDPDGEILALAREEGAAAVATVDLNRRYADQWLGDMRGRFMKELRSDVKVE
ncbi:MAG: carbon-nitrogen hydrolase family protein [Bryobacterales bacterium]|nr:carbon-nitrogen hydrolase family protein [Bryobacterales bacterium]